MDRNVLLDVIQSDQTILRIGKHIFETRRKHKDTEIKARAAMRRSARLMEATEGVTEAAQLFTVEHYNNLTQHH